MDEEKRYLVTVSTPEKTEFLYEIDRTSIYSTDEAKDAMPFATVEEAKAAAFVIKSRTKKVIRVISEQRTFTPVE